MKTKPLPTLEEVREKATPILLRYGVKRAGVFGSLARHEMNARSDIDLLVDFEKPIGLFEFVGLQLELQQALGCKVDLGEYQTLKPLLRERILQEVVPIL